MNDKVTVVRQGETVVISVDPAVKREQALQAKKTSLTTDEKLELILARLARIEKALNVDD